MNSVLRHPRFAWPRLFAIVAAVGCGLFLLPCAAATTLEVSPAGGYTGTGLTRGRFDPAGKVYTLTNTGTNPVEWAATWVGDWISVLEPEGVLAAGASTNLRVFPNGLSVALGPDFFEGLLVITNVGGGEAHLRSVSLKVSSPGPGSVEEVLATLTNLLQLVFSGPPGGVYVAESSPDFVNWSGMVTNQFGLGAVRLEIDLTEADRRFFRTYTLGSNAAPSTLRLTNVMVSDLERLLLEGDPGGTYLVESSPDETEWTPIFTNQLPATGSILFTNTISDGESNLVYQATPLGPFPAEPLHHVLITGQSLGLGIGGSPALTTLPSDLHYRLFSNGDFRALIRLVETGLETIASGAGAHLAQSHPEHRLLFSNNSVGGAVYDELKKGTEPYHLGLTQFLDAPAEVASVLLDYRPSAIFVLHGEGDHLNPEYDLDIRQWQADYERDIGLVTGRPGRIPMFHSQASAWTSPGNGASEFTLGAFLVLEESERHPDRTVLVGPKYFLPYSDGIHLTNSSYRWLGEYYAKAYRAVVVEGGTWTPLKPLAVTRSNDVVTASFYVPAPPLVLDTNLVLDPGSYGFSYHDSSGSPPDIAAVELAGPETVRLILDETPSGTGERLRYAYTAPPGSWGGPETGPRGNLRDSDETPSLHGNPLYNWCVHFDEPVAVSSLGPPPP